VVGGVLLLAIVLALGMWHPSVSGATCFRVNAATDNCVIVPKGAKLEYMVLNIALQGNFDFSQDSQGVDQNASCGNASGTTPNSYSRSLETNFDVVWYHVKVPFGPISGRRQIKAYTSGKATVSGTYKMSGSSYDANCSPISYPAPPTTCSGSLSATDKKQGTLVVNYPLPGSPPDNNEVIIDMDPLAIPYGLTPEPGTCVDDESPPDTISFTDIFGGDYDISPHVNAFPDIGSHGLGSKSFQQETEGIRMPDPTGFKTDCSIPADDETCTQTYAGQGHIYYYRVGIVDASGKS
jgi:hypothetical protein